MTRKNNPIAMKKNAYMCFTSQPKDSLRCRPCQSRQDDAGVDGAVFRYGWFAASNALTLAVSLKGCLTPSISW
jgi:hypothetical protein